MDSLRSSTSHPSFQTRILRFATFHIYSFHFADVQCVCGEPLGSGRCGVRCSTRTSQARRRPCSWPGGRRASSSTSTITSRCAASLRPGSGDGSKLYCLRGSTRPVQLTAHSIAARCAGEAVPRPDDRGGAGGGTADSHGEIAPHASLTLPLSLSHTSLRPLTGALHLSVDPTPTRPVDCRASRVAASFPCRSD
jgi:hypothetical protein